MMRMTAMQSAFLRSKGGIGDATRPMYDSSSKSSSSSLPSLLSSSSPKLFQESMDVGGSDDERR